MKPQAKSKQSLMEYTLLRDGKTRNGTQIHTRTHTRIYNIKYILFDLLCRFITRRRIKIM